VAYEAPIFDQYTALDFKSVLGGDGFGPRADLAPTWIGKEHQRRLRAYTVLNAYLTNSSRKLLDRRKTSESEGRREYGDAANIVDAFVAAVLGDEQTIHVEGAEDYDESGEGEGNTSGEAAAAHAVQEKLREWAKDERLPLKLIEGENKAVGLGDVVYSLGWNTKKKRPRLRVWDPGFYFPVIDDDSGDDFHSRIHLAWELDEDEAIHTIRRITYELRTVEPYRVPWSDEPVDQECFISDGTWRFATLDRSVDDFKESAGTYMVDEDGLVKDRALGIDYIPVVHVPNTPSTMEHFGVSVLSLVLQIIDDLQEADTDKTKASALVSTPFLGVAGARIGNEGLVFGPGSYIEMAENGKLFPVDLSAGLERLATHIEELQKRLSVNAKLPHAARGRVDSSEIESGLHLLLLFAPMEKIVRAMRLVRGEKYPLLLKFVQRFFMQAGELQGPERAAELVLGSFMPNDEAASVDLVVKLLQAGAISLETAVKMLIEAGLPIEDAAEEVRKIQERDFEGAADLLAATGNEKDVADYLGRDVSTVRPPAPPIDLDLPNDKNLPEGRG